jgi:hypothetical protein
MKKETAALIIGFALLLNAPRIGKILRDRRMTRPLHAVVVMQDAKPKSGEETPNLGEETPNLGEETSDSGSF